MLVFDELPVIFTPPSTLNPPPSTQNPELQRWVCQGWSIIDPAPNAQPRFRNYLLPIAPLPLDAPVVPFPLSFPASLFCGGHVVAQR